MSSSSLMGNYRFMVEIEGILVAGFSEVTGIEVETELEEYREGGLNTYVHKFVKGTRHVPLVLKKGLSSHELWKWYYANQGSSRYRRSGSIILFDEHFREFRRWNFIDAYPVKWVGPQLNATSSEVAIEQVELVHNGFTKYIS